MNVAAWREAITELDRLVAAGVVRFEPEPPLSEVERAQTRYDDAKHRFVVSTRDAFRLPPPYSGRAWARRAEAISDAPWFREDLNTTLFASIHRLLVSIERRLT